MSIETSSNPVGVSEEATIPRVRTFQTTDLDLGRVLDSANLFTGQVNLQLPLLSLASRGGLEVDVILSYQSEVQIDLGTRNLEAPTSIVGLGWDLPYEMIVRDFRNSVSPYDDTYYLAATDGSRSTLFLTSQTADAWIFESQDFDFSKIVYFPQRQLWHITSTDGRLRVYGADVSAGDDPAMLRQAIKWGGPQGNWTDASLREGQSIFPITWNLAYVQNPWGDRISFTYSRFVDDMVQIGSGLRYSRASYLASITDPAGRVVTFQYADKLFNDTIREYQNPHRNPNPRGLAAYQDRYETRFLDSVRVSQLTSDRAIELFSIRLAYSVDNFAAPDTPGVPADLYKRYLRGLTTVNAAGKLLPGMQFDYFDGSEPGPTIHRGALKRVRYPDGATVTYAYQAQPLAGTALDLTMSSSDPDWVPGIPRFWFGPDYVVLARYSQIDSNKLTVQVFDWNGHWLQSRPIVTQLPFALDLTTLDVSFQEDFFVINGLLKGSGTNGQVVAWAVTRNYGRFGEWSAQALEVPPLTTASGSYQLATGRDFVVIGLSGQSCLPRYKWQPRDKKWLRDDLNITTTSLGEWSMAANNNVLVVCQYQPGMPLTLTLHWMDVATLEWHDDRPPIDVIQTFVWNQKLPQLSFSISDTFAVATYIVSQNLPNNTFDYAARVYSWDTNFNPLPSPPPITGTNVPAQTEEPVFLSVAAGSLVGNVGNLLRFNGVNWVQGQFGNFNEGKQVAQFTYGNDIAIGVSAANSVVAVYDPYLDQINSVITTAGVYGPMEPTISDRYLTVRSEIYEQQTDGSFRLLQQQLPLDTVAVANQAPLYLAYAGPTWGSSVWLLRNGILQSLPIPVAGKIFVPDDQITGPGMALTGGLAFATWDGPSFDNANQLALHRVLNQQIGGQVPTFVLSSVALDDGRGGGQQASFDYDGPGATSTCGPFGLASQFSLVKSVVGSASPMITPSGWSIYQYYDGLTPQPNTPGFLYSLANGLLRQVSAFDSVGNEVARTTRVWESVQQILDAQSGRSMQLIGAYVRQKSSTDLVFDVDPMAAMAQPPLAAPVTNVFNEANGQPRTICSINFNPATGRSERIEETYLFAYEKYPNLAAPEVNQLNAWAQKNTVVDGVNTAIEAVTWESFNSVATWAQYRHFCARRPEATLSDSDWRNTTTPSNADWKLLWQVDVRDSRGEIQQWLDDTGRTNCKLLDHSQELVLATFGGASLTARQVAFIGFEPYEELSAWTLAGSTSTLEQSLAGGDTFTGTRCLLLPGTAATSPLATTFTLQQSAGQPYILSCWIASEAGIAGANATVSWPGGSASGALPDTGGQWQLFFMFADLPAGTLAVTLSIANTSGKRLRLDNLRFSPRAATFSGTVYQPLLQQQDAVVKDTGAMQRSLIYDFDEATGAIDSLDSAVGMSAAYLSTRGNLGRYSMDDPNCILRLKPRSLGFYQSFDRGDLFTSGWSSATPDQWQRQSGALHHVGERAGAIAYEGLGAPAPGEINRYGASFRVRPAGPVTAPAGFGLGPNLQLTWSPTTASWTLSDGSSATTAPVRSLLDLSFASYHAQLDQGALPPDFLSLFPLAGLPLAAGSTVTVVTAEQAWRVADSASAVIYYLVAADATIHVAVFPQQWIVMVFGATVVLFADGGRVLSHDCAAPLTTRALSLRASDALAFDNAIFFVDADTQISYLDAEGKVIQEQVPADSGMVAQATFYDLLGREAVHSQGALLAYAPGAWGVYRADLANLDWSTGVMTGVVATQNPASGSYPYSRTRFESSPLGREVERGLPGAEYAISPGGHTTRTSYGLLGAGLGVQPGSLAHTTVVDPDGITRVQLVDQRRHQVASGIQASPGVWALTWSAYDGAGNLVGTTTPMGWGDSFGYDFLGHPISSMRADEGQTQSIYDSFGRLRFQVDARGAAAPLPYVSFWKYDQRSRTVEEGCFPHAWPGELAQRADDQSYPAATPSNRYVYDFPPEVVPTDLTGFNKLVASTSQNQVSEPSQTDPFVAIESLEYDIWEDIVAHHIRLGDDPTEYLTRYEFDNQGDASAIQYPTGSGPHVEYRRDWLGRVNGIAVAGNRVLVFTYDRNGGLATETMFSDAGQQVGEVRTFGYAPPGWLASTAGSQFSETTEYAPTYHNGSPAQIVTAARDGRPQRRARFGYDTRGRLNSIDPGDGAFLPVTYDDNGNLQRLMRSTNGYTAPGKDRVQTRHERDASFTFGYDASGEQTSRTGSGSSLTATFDCFRRTPLSVRSGEIVAQTRYGLGARRVLKTIGNTAKLYLRGAGDDVLAERIVGGGDLFYIRSPRGLAQLRSDATNLYVATDRLGSIRAVIDAQAHLVAGYDYLPYGASDGAPFGSNPAVTLYRFACRELDETGLYDFRARAYDALQGRFISPDAQHQDDSPYTFAQNNPLIYTDPSGDFAFLIALFAVLAEAAEEIAVATAVGTAVGLVTGIATGAAAASQVDDPGEAAGVFFGTLFLSTAAGALSGAAGAATGAFIEGVSVTSAAAVAVGAVVQGGIAAAQSVGQAGLTGGDLTDAGWRNLVAGSVASLAGQAASSLAKIPLDRIASLSALKGTTKAVISGAASGAAGGATGAATDDLLYADDENTTLSNVLQGIAWGVLGGIVPEVAAYKVSKLNNIRVDPDKRLAQVRRNMANAIGDEDL